MVAQAQSDSAPLPAVLQTRREDIVLHLLGDASALHSKPGISPQNHHVQVNEHLGHCVSCSQFQVLLGSCWVRVLMDLCGFWLRFFPCNRKGSSFSLVSEKLMAPSSRAHLRSFSPETAESCHAWSSVRAGAVSARLGAAQR